MILLRFRILAMQRGALGRTFLMLALVGGVLVGLLAMHTISSASHEHMATASTMSVGMGMAESRSGMVAPSHAEVSTECGLSCAPDHIMASMACVLALLFSAVVLAITASRRWSTFFAACGNRRPAIITMALTALPPPPDLYALSISRT